MNEQMFLDRAGEEQGQAGSFQTVGRGKFDVGTIAMTAAGRLKDGILNQIPIFGAHQYCF